jgi:hypothetical protein
MMKARAVTIDLELLGAQFVNMGSDEQAKFFVGMAKEIKTWKSQHQAQMQFAYIVDGIPKELLPILEDVLCMIAPQKS